MDTIRVQRANVILDVPSDEKANYMAKGYEISDMLGKPYNEGMRINADFVLDENMESGTRLITSITKPQVIYKGEMIQKAIVTVTQNI